MTENPIFPILFVGQEKTDYIHLKKIISQTTFQEVKLVWSQTLENAFSSIQSTAYAVVMVAYNHGEGIKNIGELFSISPPPLILITQGYSAEAFERALEAGASCLIDKEELSPTTIEANIRHAIHIKKTENIMLQCLDDAQQRLQYTEKELLRINQRAEGLKAALARYEGVKFPKSVYEIENENVMGILERITDAFVSWDTDWRYTYINSAGEKLLGISREDLLGQDILSIFKEEDIQSIGVHLEKAMVEQTPAVFTEFFSPLNKWLEIQAYPSKEGMSLYFRDVSDAIESRKAQQESEERFKQLADSMPALVWTALPDGSIDYYNQKVREYSGIKPRSDDFWDWVSAIFPDDVDHTLGAWQQAVLTGESFQVEHRARMADGTSRWHLTRAIPIKGTHGEIIRWIGTGTDIHELKLVQEDLVKSSQHLSLLSTTATKLLSGTDPYVLLDDIFSQISEFLGLDVYLQYELLTNSSYLKLVKAAGIQEETLPSLEKLEVGAVVCSAAALERKPLIINDVQHSSDPRTDLLKSLEITAYICFPLLAQDKLIGTLSFGSRRRTHLDLESVNLLQALSDLVGIAVYERNTELALKAYAERLKNSNRELEEFAFLASHDLNEPLRKIEVFSQMLIKNAAEVLAPEELNYLIRIERASGRMREMVSGLLNLSRIKTQSKPFEDVELGQIAQEVLSDLDHLIKKTKALVNISPLPVISCDRVQIHQLLLNILTNALKFHRTGFQPQVNVSCETESEDRVTIRVSDNGVGFDEKHAERIFLPFERLGSNRKTQGSGMGLAICRKIVERHGGSITASSKIGEGSTFIITLPISHKQEEKRADFQTVG
jgi:PAS domain S-box-containing protein